VHASGCELTSIAKLIEPLRMLSARHPRPFPLSAAQSRFQPRQENVSHGDTTKVS
jgi:hypothetical protein